MKSQLVKTPKLGYQMQQQNLTNRMLIIKQLKADTKISTKKRVKCPLWQLLKL